MARKLFALESEGDDVEMMDSGSEVGEVAEAVSDSGDETTEIAEVSESVDAGLEATDSGEQLEELVEGTEEDGGMSPVAAECVRVALEAICGKVGYNPRSVYLLYATENFQSASSRKANTSIALEGVKDFLKDMWKKIKETLTKIWTKVKAFWDKHVSTLGRVVKALESMKNKVSESSGKFKDKAYLDEAPSSLVDAFAGKSDIGTKVVQDYISAHATALTALSSLTGDVTELNAKGDALSKQTQTSSEDINKALSGAIKATEVNIGTQGAPLIGGTHTTIKFGTANAGSEDNGGFDFEVDKEVIDKESKLGISIADKNALKTLVTNTQAVIKDTVKYKEKNEKLNAAVTKMMSAISSAIEKENKELVDAKDAVTTGKKKTAAIDAVTAKDSKGLRTLMKFYYKVNAKIPSISSDVFSHNIKLAKAVMSYSAFCLKQYK